MKKLVLLAFMLGCVCFTALHVSAQEMTMPAKSPMKKPRPSLPDTVKGTMKSGLAIQIDYSQPSVNARTIGKDIAPYGKVWRVGANEATVVELSKDVKIEGKALPAGKYGFYAIPGETEWVLIFNSVSKIWGLNYTKDEATGAKTDVLRVTVKAQKSAQFTEKLKFFIEPSGTVYFAWGDVKVPFKVK